MIKHYTFILLVLLISSTDALGSCIQGNCENGRGTSVLEDGTKYIGDFKNAKREGQGTVVYPSGTKYIGQWKDDKPHGQGTLTIPNSLEIGGMEIRRSTYIGEFKNGTPHGYGTLDAPGLFSYKGSFENGEKSGKGTIAYSDGQKYEGEFQNDMLNGVGIYTFPSGNMYAGRFENDQFIKGIGIVIVPHWGKFVGHYTDPNRVIGTFTLFDGTKFRGMANFKNGQFAEIKKTLTQTYQSPFKFSIELPLNWLPVSSEVLSNYPDDFFGFQDKRFQKMNLSTQKTIKKHILNGNMEIYYDLDTITNTYVDRITVSRDWAGIPKTDIEAKAECKQLEENLTNAFNMPVKFLVFELLNRNELEILHSEYEIGGIESIFVQYAIRKSGDEAIAFTAITTSRSHDLIRKELLDIILSFRWE